MGFLNSRKGFLFFKKRNEIPEEEIHSEMTDPPEFGNTSDKVDSDSLEEIKERIGLAMKVEDEPEMPDIEEKTELEKQLEETNDVFDQAEESFSEESTPEMDHGEEDEAHVHMDPPSEPEGLGTNPVDELAELEEKFENEMEEIIEHPDEITDSDIEAFDRKASPENHFILKSGKAVRSLRDLMKSMSEMDEETFQHHVTDSKNDFANWVQEILNHEKMAEQIRNKKAKHELYTILKDHESKIKNALASKTMKKFIELKTQELEMERIKLAGMQNKYDAKVNSLENERDALKGRKEELDNREHEIEKKEHEIEEQLRELESDRGSVHSEKENMMESLEQERAAFEKEKHDFQKYADERNNELSEKEGMINSDMENRRNELEEENARLRQELEAKQSDMNEKLSNLEQELANHKEELAKGTQTAEHESQIAELKQKIQTHTQREEEHKKKTDSKHAEMKKQIEDHKAEIETHKKEKENLKKDLEELKKIEKKKASPKKKATKKTTKKEEAPKVKEEKRLKVKVKESMSSLEGMNLTPEKQRTNPQVYRLLAECKLLVEKGMLDEAKNRYYDLKKEYEKANFKNVSEKNSLYYGIRELYDDINLALLG